MSAPRFRVFEEIEEGLDAEHSYALTEEVYRGFLAVAGDRSPLHTDDDFARRHGFLEKITHGAILNCFVSHFVGMVFPGEYTLELGVEIRFLRPCYIGDELCLKGTVAQKLESQRVLVVNLRFQNLTRGYPAASGRVNIKLLQEIA